MSFRFIVSSAGKATDLWLAKSLGFDLDQAAAASLLTYRFSPATYEGQTVDIPLFVEINFQLF